MAISNGRDVFVKKISRCAGFLPYKLKLSSECAVVSFKTKALPYLWGLDVQINVLFLRQILVFELETKLAVRFCSSAAVCHQWASLCGASFISDMKWTISKVESWGTCQQKHYKPIRAFSCLKNRGFVIGFFVFVLFSNASYYPVQNGMKNKRFLTRSTCI